MFYKDKFFKPGWVYFVIMFILEMILPDWMGDENGVIENIQMLWLLAGIVYCLRATTACCKDWGGDKKALWSAGAIYFFLLAMREISWGRVFFTSANGHMIEYSQMGLYGKLVHPMVGILLVTAIYLLYKAKVWRMLKLVKIPAKSFILLLLFIAFADIGEHRNFTGFHGQVAEELAEFGAYMMMYVLVRITGSKLGVGKSKETAAEKRCQ